MTTNYPAYVVATFDILEGANVSDYQADMLMPRCVTGSRYIRAVADNIQRAAFSASKGPAERETAVYWYERAVSAWKAHHSTGGAQ